MGGIDYQNDLIVRLKTEVDKGGQAALKEQAEVVDKTSAAYEKATKSTDKYGKASQRAGYRIQNASYQIADFFVMLDGGINPVRALSTQLPQLLAGFGAIGAAAGAAAAIGSSVFIAFQKMADSSEAANKKLVELGNTIEGLAVGDSAVFNQFQKAINEADEGLRDLIQKQYELAGIEADKKLKATNRELKEFVENIRFIGNRTDYERQSENAVSYVNQEVQAIINNLNAVGSGTATFIRELIIKLDEGKIGIVEFATTLTDLQTKGLISGDITNELNDLVGDLKKAEKEAQQFKEALKPDREEYVTPLKAVNDWLAKNKKLTEENKDAVEEYYDRLFDLESVRFEIGEEAYQEGIKALQELANSSLKPIVVDAEFTKAEQEAQKFVDALDRANDPMIKIKEQANLIRFYFELIGRDASEAEKAVNRFQNAFLEEITVDTSRRDAQIARGNEILADLDPIRAYRAELLQLQADLAAVGAEGDQVTEAISRLQDKFLQPIEVTAVKRPNWEEQLDLKGLEAVTADIKDSLQDWGDSLADSIIDALDRGMESFKEFADFIIREIARIALQRMIIEPLVNSLTNLFPGAASISLGEIEQNAGAASNARIESVSAVPMMGYVSAPALSSKTSNQSPVTVNVNNYGNDEVEVEQRKTSRGLEIDVLIKGAVKKGIAQGDFDNVMRSSFGTRRLAY